MGDMNQSSSTSKLKTNNAIISSTTRNSAFAGSIAGVIAQSTLFPMDTISLRLKVQCPNTKKYAGFSHALSTMFKEEGIRGFFSGVETTLMASPILSAIYFGTYEGVKSMILPQLPSQYAPVGYFVSGACSELACSVLSVPAEVIKCRLQLGSNPHNASGGWIRHHRNYRNTIHASTSILRKEGLSGLYAGYSSCLAVDVVFSAFSFTFYEQIKRSYAKFWDKDLHQLHSYELISIGSVSGGLAAFLSNPIDVVTVRMMTQGSSGHYESPKHCLESILHKEGIRGLWRGAIPRMMSIIPSTGICFGIYEMIKSILFENDLDEMEL